MKLLELTLFILSLLGLFLLMNFIDSWKNISKIKPEVPVNQIHDAEKNIATNEFINIPEKILTVEKTPVNLTNFIYDSHEAARAVNQIDDMDSLLKIVKKHISPQMRLEAAYKLDNQEIYEEIAKNTNEAYEVRHYVIQHLTNQALHAYIAVNDPNWKAREISIWRSNNREILEQIANHDSHSVVRNEAARRLDELRKQDIILTNAQINREEFEQMEEGIRTTFWFIMKNTDQKRLAEIAKNYGDDLMRRGVIPLLNDQAVLADIAKNDKVPQVRQLAIGKLEDQTILKDILENDKDEWARTTAVERLKQLENENGK